MLILSDVVDEPTAVKTAAIAAAYLLTILGGAIVAFYWTYESIPNKGANRTALGSNAVLALLTTVPAGLLTAWGINSYGPIHGVFWFVGIIAGVIIARQKIFDDYSSDGKRFPPAVYHEFRALVRRNIFQNGHAETEKLVSQKLKKIEKLLPRLSEKIIAAMHEVVHTVRDNAVAYEADQQSILYDTVTHGKWDVYDDRAMKSLRDHLRNPLEKILHLFETLTGNTTDLWIAIRMLDSGGSEQCTRCYRTLLRVGHVNEDRQQTTKPVPENVGLPKFLREEYHNGRGIVVMNINRKKNQWTKTQNDGRAEDKCLAAGPVVIKSIGHEGPSREMAGIIYVNSKVDTVSFDGLEEYLKCCTDALSLFWCLSVFPRIQFQVAKRPPENPTAAPPIV